MKRIVVVMPAYNAAKTMESVFQRIPKNIMRKIYKFIIVNDGSKDNTHQVALKIRKKYGKVKIVLHKKNKGYAGAQKTGFAEALKEGADIVVLLHSDGQYAPELMQKLIEPIEKDEADVVQGSRILGALALKGGMPLYKFIGNRIATFLENLFSGNNFAEYHSGYMLYSREVLETVPFEKIVDNFHTHKGTCHFDGEMMLVAKRMNFRIKEIPIPTRYGDEVSLVHPIKYGFEVLSVIKRDFFRTYRKLLLFV